MLDVDLIDREVFLEFKEVQDRWGINNKTLLSILKEYNLEVHTNNRDIPYKKWCDEGMKAVGGGLWPIFYLRLSVVKEFEQTKDHLFKKTKGQPGIETRPGFLSADEWRSYQEKTRAARNKGKYSIKQAHYWRSRSLFRYLNAEVLDKAELAKKEFIKASLQKTYQDIIQFGCEQVAYDLSDIERWLTEKCPIPENYEKKPKPWEDSTSDKPLESQMKRSSRLRECVQAIALIIFSRNRELTNETFVRMCSPGYLQNILDSVREDDLNDREDGHPEDKKIKLWAKNLIQSFQGSSEKNK